jgi:hypothetical protein
MPTAREKTKNPLFVNGLASFDEALDCVAPNNRLKRRRVIEPGEFRLAPGLALNIRIRTIFLTRSEGLFA